MRVLFLNPFHGGSHRAFALGWARHSRRADCLYDDVEDLADRLAAVLSRREAWVGPEVDQGQQRLAAAMERFAWARVVGEFDAELERLASGGRP